MLSHSSRKLHIPPQCHYCITSVALPIHTTLPEGGSLDIAAMLLPPALDVAYLFASAATPGLISRPAGVLDVLLIPLKLSLSCLSWVKAVELVALLCAVSSAPLTPVAMRCSVAACLGWLAAAGVLHAAIVFPIRSVSMRKRPNLAQLWLLL